MYIRLGICGPEDSVRVVLQQANAMEGIKPLTFTYEDTERVADIVQAHDNQVDHWLFTGPAPYDYVLTHKVVAKERASFPALYGANLLGKLHEAQYHKQHLLSHVSLDTIQEDRIQEVLSQFQLQEQLYVKTLSFEGYKNPDELVAFHKEQYEKGAIEAAFTCVRNVYNRLYALGVPVYRVYPSVDSVALTLKYIREHFSLTSFKKSQVAIIGLEVRAEPRFNEDPNSYAKYYRELDLKKLLLNMAEQVHGSYVQMGDGLFFIYTTRGMVEEAEQDLFRLVHDIRAQTQLKVQIGLGYGRTAGEAELHMRKALQESRELEDSVIRTIDEDKTVKENYEDQAALFYGQRKWGGIWKEQDTTPISPGMAEKIESLANYYNQRIVSPHELASWLHSSDRNARRVLTSLEKMGLARVSGEEQSGSRGRPRKIYELLF
ncbi:hypothetical protein [Salsuginibacillus kocurii]|uniref:hypothetical protein n=1 Tax=Salsuginibacillus kocurii TaxID=427078 RepID=UPI00037F3EAE|nr:hypothetical protein [Salsuginibacillus kocurii]